MANHHARQYRATNRGFAVGPSADDTRDHRPADRPMRRAATEILDPGQREAVLRRASVLHLAVNDDGAPYVVPLSFGWADGSLWFHCAPEGTKLDLIRRDPRVGFTAECDVATVPATGGCDWGVRAVSVVGRGRARIVTDEAERLRGAEAIMRHAGVPDPVTVDPGAMARTCIVRIEVEELRARRIGGQGGGPPP